MENKIDCSIIIPVYNEAKTISHCIDNALQMAQEEFNFELIVVNDGSTDDSLPVLEQYKNNTKIKVLDKSNGGVSSARNLGIKEAQGQFIYFADADDTFDMVVLQSIVEYMKASQVELVIADYYEVLIEQQRATKVTCNIEHNILFSQNDVKERVLKKLILGQSCGFATLWNKVFVKRIIEDNNFKFDEKMAHGEDWDFCIKYYQVMKNFVHIDGILYSYTLDGSGKRREKTVNDYCTIKGRKIVEDFVDKNPKLFSVEEVLQIDGSFLGQIGAYVSGGVSDKKAIKKFLKDKTVRDALKMGGNFSSEELLKVSFSRRDKIWFLLLRLGFLKLAVKLIKKWS